MATGKRIRKWGVVILCVLVVTVPGLIVVYRANHTPAREEWRKHITGINTFPILTAADSMLFHLDSFQRDLLYDLEQSDVRDDKRELSVWKAQGYISYTSIDLRDDRPLCEVLFFQNTETPQADDPSPFLPIHTRLRQGPPTDTIICSYTADLNGLREFRHSRDFVSYNLNVKTLSIRYGEHEPIDMSVIQNKDRTPRPLSFAFYKKGRKVFFLIYEPNVEKTDPAEALKDDFLGKIVKWDIFPGNFVRTAKPIKTEPE